MARWRIADDLNGVVDIDNGETVTISSPRWREYEAFVRSGGEPLPLPTPAPLDVSAARTIVKGRISSIASVRRSRLVRGAASIELVFFLERLRQARAFVAAGGGAAGAAVAPQLVREAQRRGIAPMVLANRLTQRANDLFDAEADIAATQSQHEDAIDSLSEVTDVLSYDITIGWP